MTGEIYASPHFTWSELNPSGAALTSIQLANLQRTAQLLESLRDALFVPLRVTSGFRTAADNARVGGADGSQHLTGSAADVVPQGISISEAYRRFRQAYDGGHLDDFSQVIFYPYDGHIHIALPTSKHGEQLVQDATGGYVYAHEFYGYPAPRSSALAGAARLGGLALLLFLVGTWLLTSGGFR